MSQKLDYETKLGRVLALDENIRYAAVCDMEGKIMTSKSKGNSDLYLSPEETQETLLHAAKAWKSRMRHYDKIGKGLYTLAVYEKLRRVTIPLSSGNLLLVTIDNKGGQKQIIDRILNEVNYADYTVG
ncbi:hypothetical protein C6988_07075 [Nitrosopumilus sp. b1]|uniref:hypothetical protein n=1 Tax=Nitrosopumilus sp. b1 TaxID=2109907 RepID=UPI0015F51D8F|nr:hypothetical protein [Nitrosopumilus sp. b1]KAF6242924.1 hypothetical protein C6988_07075 [Nitrosopumilus sp. b1]